MEIIYKFSGKSIAALISEQSFFYEEEDANWRWLKKLKLKPRVNIFWWKLIHKAIPTNDFLMYRRIINFNGCPRGCEDIEDANHLTVKCSFMNKIIILLNNWGYDIPDLNNLDNCFNWLSKASTSNPFIANIYCFAVFFSWKSTNKRVHGLEEDSISSIAGNAVSFASLSFSQDLNSVNWVSNQQLLFQNTWKPPPTKWIKLNVDAALNNNYSAGIGGVIRDCKGRFLFAFGIKTLHWDISSLKLEALLSIKKFTQECMYKAKGIIIEGDNYNVMKHIQDILKNGPSVSNHPNLLDFLS
ncbi:uncharacterized protein LOC110108400 [Dendrobium catenatum]|uniref:uncharacterized protein LOC110108400 n=1 Tax=Dendrobium catenatum TaxID=906689 RepID=UPI0009F61BC6|nr:uncharacterized protein LOC110108400 [Dendrobium catenatum]